MIRWDILGNVLLLLVVSCCYSHFYRALFFEQTMLIKSNYKVLQSSQKVDQNDKNTLIKCVKYFSSV